MATVKLTLSANADTVAKAKELARAHNISVSAMFSRYVERLAGARDAQFDDLGPLTRRASGIARLPEGKSCKELLEEALAETDEP